MKHHAMGAFAGAALALAATPGLSDEYTYGSFLQPTVSTVVAGTLPYFERVAEKTGGEVTFETFWGGSMGGPKELLGSIENGVLDSGLIVDVYTKRSLPNSASLSSAFILAQDQWVWTGAVNEFNLLRCPECRADFERNNQIGLAWYSTTPYKLQCTSEIATLADLQGKKVRSVSRLADLMSFMGAVPVSVTVAEMYEAMQRGQVDCALASTNYLNAFNIKDFVTSIVETPIGAYVSTLNLSVNLDAWDAMGEANRTIIIDEIPQMLSEIMVAAAQDDESALADALAKGAKVQAPDQAFLDKLAEMRAKEWEAVAVQAGEDGAENPEALISGFRETVEKWRGIMDEIGRDDPAAYEEALRREIFSKLEP